MADQRTELTSDERPIASVWFHGENAGGFQAGISCDKIEPYAEHGQMSMVPWIRIIAKGQIMARFPAECVMIQYDVEL